MSILREAVNKVRKFFGQAPVNAADEIAATLDNNFKISSGRDLELLKTTCVGFGREYDNKLAIRKSKSQRKNWSKWKRRGF